MSEVYDVFVCGAGPVGLFFAYQMALRGHSVYCVDTKPKPTNQSRALLVTIRTMEILENKGLGPEVLYESRALAGFRMFHKGEVIGKINAVGDTPHPYILILNQGKTEEIIKNKIESDTACKIHWETELVSYTQDENGVTSTVHDMKTNTEYTIRSKYIIGADGSHSKVRKGNPEWTYDGVAINTKLLLGDMNIQGENIPQMKDRMNAFVHGKYILGMAPMNPMGESDNYSNLFRIFCNVNEYEISPDQSRLNYGKQDEEPPTLEEIQAMVNEITAPLKFQVSDLVWSSYFRINERMANGFRKGKAFLIGDSAHCHSPAGGQGMNLGLQDADNLVWKLSDVLNGVAADPEELLDSYSSEREVHAKSTIEATSRGTRIALTDSPIFRMARLFVVSKVLKIRAFREFAFKLVTQQLVAINPKDTRLVQASDKGLIQGGTFLPDTSILRKTFITRQQCYEDHYVKSSLRDLLIKNTQYVAIFVGTCQPYNEPNKNLIEKFWRDTSGFPIRRLVVQSVWYTSQAKEFPEYISKEEYDKAENSFFGEDNIDLPISLTQRVGLYSLLSSNSAQPSVVLFVRPDLYVSHAKLVNNEADLRFALDYLSTIYSN